MVCFCDIPLSQIRKHVAVYGQYGIGLTKEWGLGRKVAPVYYLVKDSVSAEAIRRIFAYSDKAIRVYNDFCERAREIRRKGLANKHFDEASSVIDTLCELVARANANVLNLVPYIKPYQGIFPRAGEGIINLYDEREWRYVPSEEALLKRNMCFHVASEIYNDPYKLQLFNNQLRAYFKLSFEPQDVKYIIVKTEAEVLQMARRIEEIQTPKYDSNAILELITRVISMERIFHDF